MKNLLLKFNIWTTFAILMALNVLDELGEFLLNERKIAKFKLPERLEFIDELPVNKVGKFEKKSLREKITAILISEGKYKAEKEESQKPLKSVKETL